MRRGLALIEPSPVLSASCLPEASEERCQGEVRSREQIKGVFLTGTRGHVQGWKEKNLRTCENTAQDLINFEMKMILRSEVSDLVCGRRYMLMGLLM